MNERHDQSVLDIVLRSALISRIERLARLVGRAAADSRALHRLEGWRRSVAAHAGITLLVAAVVHVVLVGALVRPAHWYWLFLPSRAVAAAIVLITVQRRRSAAPIE